MRSAFLSYKNKEPREVDNWLVICYTFFRLRVADYPGKLARVKSEVKMLYRAKSDKDLGVKGCKVIGREIPFGYELVNTYFVDNSGFGDNSEPALPFNRFLDKVKADFYYAIREAGQFQVYIGEYRKVNRKKICQDLGIANSKLISKSCRVINYINGNKTIKLYATDILQFIGNKIILNTGGYKTVTTKARINQFLPNNIRVYQKNRQWFIDKAGQKLEFFDGIELTA